MFQGFGGRDALGGVDRQHLIDQIFGFGRHRIPLRWRVLNKEEEKSIIKEKVIQKVWKRQETKRLFRVLRRRLQLWSVRTIDADPHPRKVGIQPIKCTKWHLENSNQIKLFSITPSSLFLPFFINRNRMEIRTKTKCVSLPHAQISTGLP